MLKDALAIGALIACLLVLAFPRALGAWLQAVLGLALALIVIRVWAWTATRRIRG